MGNVHHVSIHLKGFHHLDYVNFHSTQIACHHLFLISLEGWDPIFQSYSNFEIFPQAVETKLIPMFPISG